MSSTTFQRVVLALSLMSFLGTARAATARNDGIGYAFDLPANWVPIPSSEVDRLAAFVTSGQAGGKFKYVAAYQLNQTPGKFFTYPYVIVQTTPYPGGQRIRNVSESELRTLVATLTGMGDKELRKELSTQASSLVAQTGKFTGSYSTNPPGFRVNMVQTVRGIGDVRGEITAIVGRDYVVAVNFYTRLSEWDTYASARQQITSSFQLDADQAVAIGTASLPSSPATKIFTTTAIGAGLGGVVGLCAWLFKRK